MISCAGPRKRRFEYFLSVRYRVAGARAQNLVVKMGVLYCINVAFADRTGFSKDMRVRRVLR